MVVRVSDMRRPERWRQQAGEGGTREYYYRDEDGSERSRYVVKESDMMMMVESSEARGGGMKGLFATRRYEKGEVITVYVGEKLGKVGMGGEDELERIRAEDRGGGGEGTLWRWLGGS